MGNARVFAHHRGTKDDIKQVAGLPARKLSALEQVMYRNIISQRERLR